MPWSTRFNGLTNQRRVMDADAGKIGGFPPWCRSRRNPFLIQFLCPSSGIKISGCGIPEAAAITVAFSIPVRKKIQGEIWQRRTARFKQIETKKMNNRKKSPGFVEFQAVFVNCSSWWAEPGPDRLLPQNGEKCGRGAALLEQKNAIISNCSTSFSFTLRYFGIFGNEFNELLHISPPPLPLKHRPLWETPISIWDWPVRQVAPLARRCPNCQSRGRVAPGFQFRKVSKSDVKYRHFPTIICIESVGNIFNKVLVSFCRI